MQAWHVIAQDEVPVGTSWVPGNTTGKWMTDRGEAHSFLITNETESAIRDLVASADNHRVGPN